MIVAESIPATNCKPKTSRRGRNPKRVERPPLDPDTLYDRRGFTMVTGLSRITAIRAYQSGHLEGYRAGTRVLHSGAQILSWLKAGGRTS